MWLMHYFEAVASPTGSDATEWDRVRTDSTLVDWVEFKADRLPGALAVLFEQEQWALTGEE